MVASQGLGFRGILPSSHRPAKTIEASYFMLVVQVKPAATKQPDKKDNQYHETDNADTASGSVPVIAVIAAEAATANEQ